MTIIFTFNFDKKLAINENNKKVNRMQDLTFCISRYIWDSNIFPSQLIGG